MFDRYTEKARRTIFFGRFAASEHGAVQIEAEHLLLGLVKEGLERGLQFPEGAVESIRRAIVAERPAGQNRTGTSVDMMLSKDARKVLEMADQEREAMGDKELHQGHLLLGFLLVPGCLAAQALQKVGYELEPLRAEVRAVTDRGLPPE
ncbi:Clp protease N-terminal domain-containing protein [Paludibaculum fermentans]|uniref:Clp protease N-terminal domain-containing protein n=1 Tax=Paludibaculum fermentans TaxID=1473598 RepID=UPI003EC10A88